MDRFSDLGEVKHIFDHDEDRKHPVCPLRAYQDVELINILVPPSTGAQRKKKNVKKVAGKTAVIQTEKAVVAKGGKPVPVLIAPGPGVQPSATSDEFGFSKPA